MYRSDSIYLYTFQQASAVESKKLYLQINANQNIAARLLNEFNPRLLLTSDDCSSKEILREQSNNHLSVERATNI